MINFRKFTAILACAFLSAGFIGCEDKNDDTVPETSTEAATEEGVTVNPSSADGSVLYESERMKITFVNETKDEYNRNLNFSVENFTDEQLMLAANDISISGRMFDPFLYAVCPGGETSEATMEFSLIELERAGIDELTELSFAFFITDGSSANGLETSELVTLSLRSGTPLREVVGEELYSDENMRVAFVEAFPSNLGAGYACVYVENYTDRNIAASVMDVYIDGEYVDTEMFELINAGKNKVCYMDFWDEGILTEDSEKISFNVGLLEPETYEIVAETGNITASVK